MFHHHLSWETKETLISQIKLIIYFNSNEFGALKNVSKTFMKDKMIFLRLLCLFLKFIFNPNDIISDTGEGKGAEQLNIFIRL